MKWSLFRFQYFFWKTIMIKTNVILVHALEEYFNHMEEQINNVKTKVRAQAP